MQFQTSLNLKDKQISDAENEIRQLLRASKREPCLSPYSAKANAAATTATPQNLSVMCDDAAPPVKGVMLEVALALVGLVVAAATPEPEDVVVVDAEPTAEARAEVSSGVE